MPRSYTRKEILQLCEEKSQNFPDFYKQEIVNYGGKNGLSKTIGEDGQIYTEIVAQYLLEHKELFDQIQIVRRTRRKESERDGVTSTSNREEENIAKRLYNQSKIDGMIFSGFGEIIDYQTPLKNSNSDKGLGKIDLLSYKNNKIFVLELKKPSTSESLLRCVLESYTYSKTVDINYLVERCPQLNNKMTIVASPLVFVGSRPWLEYQKPEQHPFLFDLMKYLNIEPFFIKEGGYYSVK